jgi:hypothetical protein
MAVKMDTPFSPEEQQKGIDSLYNPLETMIDVTSIKSNNTSDMKRSISTLSIASSISNSSISSSSGSSNSSSTTTRNKHNSHNTITSFISNNDTSCTCNHFLISLDSKHCSICDQLIPQLDQLEQEKSKLKEHVYSLQSQIEDKQSYHHMYIKDASLLQATYAKRQQRLHTTSQQIESLQEDIAIVQLKHKDEIAHASAIEQSKKGVETELHDLTQKLFEEANAMVLAEKQQKLQLQQQHDHVKFLLDQSETELSAVQAQLQTLRTAMAVQQQSTTTTNCNTTHENYILRAQLDMSSLLKHSQPIMIQTVYRDDLLLDEFQQFIVSLPTVPLTKLASLPFMKLCLKSDIEPCLRFGPSPKITCKKMIDAILAKTCFVETCPAGYLEKVKAMPVMPLKVKTRLWDRFSAIPNNDRLSCQACGRISNDDDDEQETLDWRFRISYFDEWSLIDRYCHDRIVSVIDFYTFVRQLRIGTFKELDLQEVFAECSRLRLQMLLSR